MRSFDGLRVVVALSVLVCLPVFAQESETPSRASLSETLLSLVEEAEFESGTERAADQALLLARVAASRGDEEGARNRLQDARQRIEAMPVADERGYFSIARIQAWASWMDLAGTIHPESAVSKTVEIADEYNPGWCYVILSKFAQTCACDTDETKASLLATADKVLAQVRENVGNPMIASSGIETAHAIATSCGEKELLDELQQLQEEYAKAAAASPSSGTACTAASTSAVIHSSDGLGGALNDFAAFSLPPEEGKAVDRCITTKIELANRARKNAKDEESRATIQRFLETVLPDAEVPKYSSTQCSRVASLATLVEVAPAAVADAARAVFEAWKAKPELAAACKMLSSMAAIGTHMVTPDKRPEWICEPLEVDPAVKVRLKDQSNHRTQRVLAAAHLRSSCEGADAILHAFEPQSSPSTAAEVVLITAREDETRAVSLALDYLTQIPEDGRFDFAANLLPWAHDLDDRH